jgi:hypothetical protein
MFFHDEKKTTHTIRLFFGSSSFYSFVDVNINIFRATNLVAFNSLHEICIFFSKVYQAKISQDLIFLKQLFLFKTHQASTLHT